MSWTFSSKATTLEQLSNRITTSRVLPISKFTVSQWKLSNHLILQKIETSLGLNDLIVRSSSVLEDSNNESNAGKFLSILNVSGKENLSNAIDKVINSYDVSNVDNLLFVQPMAKNIIMSGVAMTIDPSSGYPYYIINYTKNNNTTNVTAGNGHIRSYLLLKSTSQNCKNIYFTKIICLLKELEEICKNDALDIEFGIDAEGVILFQVRPLTKVATDKNNIPIYINNQSLQIKPFIKQVPLGKQIARFGIMSDWNPAEMIGLKPKNLAYSIYREMITSESWAIGRFHYGYKDMRTQELMYQFAGTPYIHIPTSMKSFIPSAVGENITNKIVEATCEFLAKHQRFHDKIEFSVIPTCYTPDLLNKKSAFRKTMSTLTDNEYATYISELLKLTNNIISPNGLFTHDMKILDSLPIVVKKFYNNDLANHISIYKEAKSMAVIFSRVARAAFIAITILKYLESNHNVAIGYVDKFIGTTNTIARTIITDFKTLPLTEFLRKHGHVRPGTYDILIPSYAENPNIYFDSTKTKFIKNETFSLSLDFDFKEHGLSCSASEFVTFAKNAIIAREEVKYWYSALISNLLTQISIYGQNHGFDNEELSMYNINEIISNNKITKSEIELRQQIWQKNSQIRVPYIICDPNDFFEFEITNSCPNYITNNSVYALTHVINKNNVEHNLDGKIVLIESADPGFDWIFTKQISGLVTAFGGENSHMSIRAREFNIPAVIGVGGPMFKMLSASSKLLLDCKSKLITRLE